MGRFPWDIGDLGVFLCCLFYTIGCIFGGFFDYETVDKFLPLINHMFLYGSLSLALEPGYQAILFVVGGGSCLSRMKRTKLCGSPSHQCTKNSDIEVDIEHSSSCSTNDNNNGENSFEKHAEAQLREPTNTRLSNIEAPLKLNWDRCFELGAMIFFCAAGVFGGFPPHPSWALPGQYFWEVGSLFAVARSIVMIHRRKKGLKRKEVFEQ